METHSKVPNIFTTFDLELAQPSNKIIEIGAVIGKLDTGEILERLSLIVNPNEQLSEFIIGLTGITQEMVNNGTDLQIAYGKLCMAHIKHGAFHSPITWGQGDVECLKQQVMAENHGKFLFGRRYFDAKTLFQSYCLANGMKLQSGLAKSLTRVGLNFKGRKHSGVDDAENTFIIFRELMNGLKKPQI